MLKLKNLDSFLSRMIVYFLLTTRWRLRNMEPPKRKDPQIFDMIVIVGLIFNALIAIFLVLYWLNLV